MELSEDLEEMELDIDKVPLEGDEALRAVEEDVNITQMVREMHLEDQKAWNEATRAQQERKAPSDVVSD